LPFPPEPRIQLICETPEPSRSEYNLQAAVETVAWQYLYDLYCGWENNDGAFGIFVFDVAGRTVTLEHNERYTGYNTKTHDL